MPHPYLLPAEPKDIALILFRHVLDLAIAERTSCDDRTLQAIRSARSLLYPHATLPQALAWIRSSLTVEAAARVHWYLVNQDAALYALELSPLAEGVDLLLKTAVRTYHPEHHDFPNRAFREGVLTHRDLMVAVQAHATVGRTVYAFAFTIDRESYWAVVDGTGAFGWFWPIAWDTTVWPLAWVWGAILLAAIPAPEGPVETDAGQ